MYRKLQIKKNGKTMKSIGLPFGRYEKCGNSSDLKPQRVRYVAGVIEMRFLLTRYIWLPDEKIYDYTSHLTLRMMR
jgi:hypothetical protein